ncbi:MAG: ABC transporter substrate-binding protein, partial [Casimicrobiaceae bacterium]
VKHNRWLEDALGIPIRWIRYPSGASVNRAVSNRQVDIGLAGSTAIAGGVPAGLSYKVVWIYDIIGSAEALVVRDGAGIKSIGDLVGKRVAVPFGATTHYALLEDLTRSHVDMNRVTIMDLEPADIVKAWQNGVIDAAYIWQPSLAKLLNHGGTVLVDSHQLARHGVLTADLGFVSDELASDFPDVVRTWLKQENRAVELIQSDPAKAAQSIGAELGISAPAAQAEMKGYQFLTAREQLSGKYFGKPGQPGRLIDQLTRAAVFQHDYPQTIRFIKEKLYRPEPTRKDFEEAVDTSFLTQMVRN